MTGPGAHRRPVDTQGDPLTFAVSGLLAEPPGSLRDYDVDRVDVDPGDGLRLTEPVSGTVRLSRTNRGLLVDARLKTALAGECARCLRPVVTPVKLRLKEEILPTIDLVSGQPVPLEEGEDLDTPRLTDHHELDRGRPAAHPGTQSHRETTESGREGSAAPLDLAEPAVEVAGRVPPSLK